MITSLYAFDEKQIKLAKKIYSIGKTFKTKDGMSIEKTLTAISLRESSLGKYVLGDKKENGEFKPLKEMSLGPFQIRVFTAREIIKENKLRKYKKYLKNDTALINKLITDVEFGAKLSAYYFIKNYNEALRRGMSRPYYRAISRHNGGWNNKPYYTALMKNLRSIRKLDFVKMDEKQRYASKN
jgi:predicted DNA-binding antitoxin AbrB/MazE fold protein